MKKLLPILPLLAVILACQALTGRPASVTSPANEPTMSAPSAQSTPAEAPVAGHHLTIVRLHPADGDLSTQLAAEAQKAAALGQQPVAYFDASW